MKNAFCLLHGSEPHHRWNRQEENDVSQSIQLNNGARWCVLVSEEKAQGREREQHKKSINNHGGYKTNERNFYKIAVQSRNSAFDELSR